MNNTLLLTISFATGIFVGLIFFAGLWWTIRKGLQSKRPASLFLGSLLLRTSLVLTGFYFVVFGLHKSQHELSLPRMTICLLGFLLARFFVQRQIKLQYAIIDKKPSSERA